MAYEDTEDYKNLMKAQAREAANAAEPGKESMVEFMKRTGAKANRPKATVGAPKVVTKEQMKKAGFDNLRDYLNAQKGLKRRDNFASEAQKKAFSSGPRGTQTEGTQGEAEARAIAEMRRKASMPGSKEDAERDAREKSTAGALKETPPVKKDRTGSEVMADKQERAAKVMRDARKAQYSSLKSGGSVKMSGASKRADGCAVRGKTRGKMV